MDASAFYRGTSAEQDGRFNNKDQEQLKKMKFPRSFNEKVFKKKQVCFIMLLLFNINRLTSKK